MEEASVLYWKLSSSKAIGASRVWLAFFKLSITAFHLDSVFDCTMAPIRAIAKGDPLQACK